MHKSLTCVASFLVKGRAVAQWIACSTRRQKALGSTSSTACLYWVWH